MGLTDCFLESFLVRFKIREFQHVHRNQVIEKLCVFAVKKKIIIIVGTYPEMVITSWTFEVIFLKLFYSNCGFTLRATIPNPIRNFLLVFRRSSDAFF
jgi:hypothetical protein